MDGDLAADIKRMIRLDEAKPRDERLGECDPCGEGLITPENEAKYSAELFGVLVSKAEGKTVGVLKGVQESSGKQDGFRGLLTMCRRFDVKTPASLLQSYLEVVTPGVIKGVEDIPGFIYSWEEKVVNLGPNTMRT